MYATLRAGILGIALMGSVGCAVDDESLDGDEVVDIELAPVPLPNPPGGGSSGGDACGSVPEGGSDRLLIAYSADKEGDCCWNNYVQKTYKPFQTRYLLCSS